MPNLYDLYQMDGLYVFYVQFNEFATKEYGLVGIDKNRNYLVAILNLDFAIRRYWRNPQLLHCQPNKSSNSMFPLKSIIIFLYASRIPLNPFRCLDSPYQS